jgi:hypothetical protein
MEVLIMPINESSETVSNRVNGVFNMDRQTTTKRIFWLISTPFITWFFLKGVVEIFMVVGKMEYMDFAFFTALVVLAGALSILGWIRIFQKNGIYFTGFRVTEDGIQRGSVDVKPESIIPKTLWGAKPRGKFGAWTWESRGKLISAKDILVVVVLQVDKAKFATFVEFKKIVIMSQNKVLDEIEIVNSTLCGVNENKYDLYNVFAVTEPSLIQSLTSINSIMSKAHPESPPLFSLLLVREAESLAPAILFGLSGGIFVVASDAYKRRELHSKFLKGEVFNKQSTKQLVEFAEKFNWSIETG